MYGLCESEFPTRDVLDNVYGRRNCMKYVVCNCAEFANGHGNEIYCFQFALFVWLQRWKGQAGTPEMRALFAALTASCRKIYAL